jgi:hypothetical protein
LIDHTYLAYGDVVALSGGDLTFDNLFLAILPPKQIKN